MQSYQMAATQQESEEFKKKKNPFIIRKYDGVSMNKPFSGHCVGVCTYWDREEKSAKLMRMV